MVPIKGNVIDSSYFKQRSTEILDYVANAIAKTMGPYGHNVLIQSTDRVSSTKDGWNVMKSIAFNDIFDNSIKSMIENAAQSVVLKVGDGTTTVTVAANELNKEVCKLVESNNYTIREIEDTLCKVVDDIIVELKKNAIAITEENLYEAIKKVAMVSTNWNEELSDMIATIYEQTHNPIIKVMKSGTDKTSYKIIDGYDLSASLMLGEYFKTDMENGKCVIEKPWMFVTDSPVQLKHFVHLSLIGDVLGARGIKLVVMAPSFDTGFINKLRSASDFRRNNRQPAINIVPVKVNGTFKIDRECLGDFCTMIGAHIINLMDADTINFFDDLYTAMVDNKDHERTAAEEMERRAIMEAAVNFLTDRCGTCKTVTIDDRSIIAEGIDDTNMDIIADKRTALNAEIASKLKDCDALTMLTDDIRMKRIRLGKLNCKMGILYVGGFGDGNLKAREDAVDDATRACEAAFRNGYTIGSGLAIIKAILDTSNDRTEDKGSLYLELLESIHFAFVTVFKNLLHNKYSNFDGWEFPTADEYVSGKLSEGHVMTAGFIANTCAAEGKGYNIITDKMDTEGIIVNPVDVDIEVLKGCLRLVLMMATSDQFVSSNIFASAIAEDVHTVAETFKDKPEI